MTITELDSSLANHHPTSLISSLLSLFSRCRRGPFEPFEQVRLSTLLKGVEDMASMAEVAYADTKVKLRAEDDANVVIECIMSGRLEKRLKAMAKDRASAAAEAAATTAGGSAAASGSAGFAKTGGGDGGKGAERGRVGSHHPPATPKAPAADPDADIVEVLASFLAPPPLSAALESASLSSSSATAAAAAAASSSLDGATLATATAVSERPGCDGGGSGGGGDDGRASSSSQGSTRVAEQSVNRAIDDYAAALR